MAKKENSFNLSEVLSSDNTVSEKVDILVDAYDKNLLGTKDLHKLQKPLGNLYAPFVREIHLRW